VPPHLSKLTSPESRALFTPRTIALLPIGCTEPHGPHLPLDTDVTIALAQSQRSAELLEQAGIPTLLLPPLSYGLTNFTDGFPGRITLRPGTLWALLEDIVTSLEQQEIRQVVFANAHLEPEHVKILRGIEYDHPERGPQKAQVLFPDNTRRRWAQTLGEEFLSGDCHAGRYETSLVLAADPSSVRESSRGSLPPVRIDLLTKMQAGARSFLEAGATDAYCGDPAAASAEEGRDLIERLARMSVESIRECWPDLFA
jgi:creatinine amidohydrolase